MRLVCTTLSAAFLLFGCASPPERSASLEDARATLIEVGATRDLTPEAAFELGRARDELRAAESAHEHRKDAATVDHLAYLAKQRALLAKERDRLAHARSALASAQSTRDKVMLEARDRALEGQKQALSEANAASKRAAEVERRAAMQQKTQEEEARREAERHALAAEARRAALAEREENERRAREQRRRKPPAAAASPPKVAARTDRAHRAPDATASGTAGGKANGSKPAAGAAGTPGRTEAQRETEEKTTGLVEGKANAPKAAPEASGGPAGSERPGPSARADQHAVPASPASRSLKVTDQGGVVALTNDLFHAGAAFLRPGATRAIEPLAEFLRAHPERRVRIDSFAQAFERGLSGGRAKEVRDALVRRGVAPDRIQTATIVQTSDSAPHIEIRISDEGGNLASR